MCTSMKMYWCGMMLTSEGVLVGRKGDTFFKCLYSGEEGGGGRNEGGVVVVDTEF